MRWKFIFVSIMCMALLAGCCSHTWMDATCTTPKTCSECGTTEGDVVHNYEKVSCTDIRVCLACGKEEFPAGHDWVEATCSAPKTCNNCGETEGAVLEHSTRLGKCSICKKDINDIEFKDGFAVVTRKDTVWMQEKEDFVDIFVGGTIQEISDTNNILLVDADGGQWTVGVGTACDLSNYIETECEVYGFSSGGISEQYKTPFINMSHENNRIVFADRKELYPKNFESTQQFADKYFQEENLEVSGTVWVPTDGGTKYHSRESCSSMDKPKRIDKDEAVSMGYSKCGRCW